jgi:hypothetical protein
VYLLVNISKQVSASAAAQRSKVKLLILGLYKFCTCGVLVCVPARINNQIHLMMKEKLLNWLNLILVADVFLVLFGFGWLAMAAIGDAAGVNLGLDLWHQLWQPVFNPAIGILMGGAILSGLLSWVSRKFQAD